jgi:hypothetical protein
MDQKDNGASSEKKQVKWSVPELDESIDEPMNPWKTQELDPKNLGIEDGANKGSEAAIAPVEKDGAKKTVKAEEEPV